MRESNLEDFRAETIVPYIGVTGTRNGMNETQTYNVKKFLHELGPVNFILHHGDCIGVDVEIASIAEDLNQFTVSHPPVDESLRAFHKSERILTAKTHFARNRDIVDSSDLLIVVPMDNERKSKGGTWYTYYDYAIKRNVPVKVFYPDGRVES